MTGFNKGDGESADLPRMAYTFSEWQAELRQLDAYELDEFFHSAMEEGKPYIGKMQFYAGLVDRFYDLAHFSRVLTEEGRKECLLRAEKIVEMVNHVFHNDAEAVTRFNSAVEASRELGGLFGYGTAGCARFAEMMDVDGPHTLDRSD
jgi:hypothetical protein